MPLGPEFNRAEALDLVALSAIVEGGAAPPQPTGWNMIFDSPVIGQFNEKWQLWQNASGSYAIVLRGTVLDAGSILEDLLSFLIPASGRLTIGHIQIDYSFAASSDASVHFGFALGTLLLLKDPQDGILVQLASKVPPGSSIYIAGHSQGPASTSPFFHPLISSMPVPKSLSLGRLVPELNAKMPFSSTMPLLTSRCCRHKFHKLDNSPRCLLSSPLLHHRRVLAVRAIEDANLGHVFEIAMAYQTHRIVQCGHGSVVETVVTGQLLAEREEFRHCDGAH